MQTSTVDLLDIDPFGLVADEPTAALADVRAVLEPALFYERVVQSRARLAKYDPLQRRDGDGQWTSTGGTVKDALGLAKRIALGDGETFVASDSGKIQSGRDELGVPMALVNTLAGPRLRLGEESNGDATAWDADPDLSVRAELSTLQIRQMRDNLTAMAGQWDREEAKAHQLGKAFAAAKIGDRERWTKRPATPEEKASTGYSTTYDVTFDPPLTADEERLYDEYGRYIDGYVDSGLLAPGVGYALRGTDVIEPGVDEQLFASVSFGSEPQPGDAQFGSRRDVRAFQGRLDNMLKLAEAIEAGQPLSAHLAAKYDPGQKRDGDGKWSDGGPDLPDLPETDGADDADDAEPDPSDWDNVTLFGGRSAGGQHIVAFDDPDGAMLQGGGRGVAFRDEENLGQITSADHLDESTRVALSDVDVVANALDLAAGTALGRDGDGDPAGSGPVQIGAWEAGGLHLAAFHDVDGDFGGFEPGDVVVGVSYGGESPWGDLSKAYDTFDVLSPDDAANLAEGLRGAAASTPKRKQGLDRKVDKLRLDGRIDLAVGERLVGSAKFNDSGNGVATVAASVDGPAGTQLRLGLTYDDYVRDWGGGRDVEVGETVLLEASGIAQLRAADLVGRMVAGTKAIKDLAREVDGFGGLADDASTMTNDVWTFPEGRFTPEQQEKIQRVIEWMNGEYIEEGLAASGPWGALHYRISGRSQFGDSPGHDESADLELRIVPAGYDDDYDSGMDSFILDSPAAVRRWMRGIEALLVTSAPANLGRRLLAEFDEGKVKRDGEGKFAKSAVKVAAELEDILARLEGLKGSLPEDERSVLADKVSGLRESSLDSIDLAVVESHGFDAVNYTDVDVHLDSLGRVSIEADGDEFDPILTARQAAAVADAVFQLARPSIPDGTPSTEVVGERRVGVVDVRRYGDGTVTVESGDSMLEFADTAEARDFAQLLEDVTDSAGRKGMRAHTRGRLRAKFDPGQKRDSDGKWSDGSLADFAVMSPDQYNADFGESVDEQTARNDSLAVRFHESGQGHLALDLSGGRTQVLSEQLDGDEMREVADAIKGLQDVDVDSMEEDADGIVDSATVGGLTVGRYGNGDYRLATEGGDDYLDLTEDDADELWSAFDGMADSWHREFETTEVTNRLRNHPGGPGHRQKDHGRKKGMPSLPDVPEVAKPKTAVPKRQPKKALPQAVPKSASTGVRLAKLTKLVRAPEVRQAHTDLSKFPLQYGSVEGDRVAKALAKQRDFTAKPTTMPSADLDAFIAAGNPQMYRGAGIASAGAQFRDGDYYASLGDQGNGVYFSYRPADFDAMAQARELLLGRGDSTPVEELEPWAQAALQRRAKEIESADLRGVYQSYAGRNSSIIKASLGENARVSTWDDIYDRQQPVLALLRKKVEAAGGAEKQDLQADFEILSDLGHFATAEGLTDAYLGRVSDEIVVLNRGSVLTADRDVTLTEDITGRPGNAGATRVLKGKPADA